MNLKLWSTVTAVAVVYIASLSFAAEADDGRETGNGGDAIAVEFLLSAQSALDKISKMPRGFEALKMLAISRTLAKAVLTVTDEPLTVTTPDGRTQNSAAVNYASPPRIIVQRQMWSIIASPLVREALALHEALGLVGIESTGHYPYTNEYLRQLNAGCDFDNCLSQNDLEAWTRVFDPIHDFSHENGVAVEGGWSSIANGRAGYLICSS